MSQTNIGFLLVLGAPMCGAFGGLLITGFYVNKTLGWTILSVMVLMLIGFILILNADPFSV